MTTYNQSLLKKSERTQKMLVREFLFSLFTHLQLNKIIGLAGPNINDYLSFCKSKGFNEFEIYEVDGITAIHQLAQAKDAITLKLGNIIDAPADEPNTLYDLDYCVSVRHMHDHIAKFNTNFIMTFSTRISLMETLDTFFNVRNERVIKSSIKKHPLQHTVYQTNKGKYVYIPYRDTSAMCCFAKIA